MNSIGGVLSRKSVFGALPVAVGAAWKTAEVAHTAEYVEKATHDPMPLVCILIGLIWSLGFEIRRRRMQQQLSNAAPVLSVIPAKAIPVPSLPAAEPMLPAVALLDKASDLAAHGAKVTIRS